MKKINFNDAWLFKKEISSMMGELTEGNSAVETMVTLPHDAMVMEPRNEKNPSGNAGGFYPGGDYCYTKTFSVPQEDEGKTYVLEFEGIYNRGRLYVNGSYVDSVHYGYTRLISDITPYLNYGADNVVMVKVTNSDVPNSRWYTGSGLYRPVSLYIGEDIRIPVDGLRVSTPDVSEDVSLVCTEIPVEYDGKRARSIRVNTILKDAKGNTVASESTPVTLFSGNIPVVKQRIYLRDAKLWSLEHPDLYFCEVELLEGDERKDTASTVFGIRRIQLDPVNGLRLNGEPVLLRGSCIHHDNGAVGAATFARAEERRVELSKAAGFNALRIAHNTASKALLDACDRIGMLVMDESFDMWNTSKSQYDFALDFADYCRPVLEDIVAKDYNHPSVFMYSIGNEIQEVGTPSGANWSRLLSDKFRELDPTRLVTNAINGLMTIMDKLPVVMMDLGLLTAEQLQAMDSGEQAGGDVNDMMTLLMGQMNYLTSHHTVGEVLEESFSSLDAVGLNYMRDSYEIYEKAFPNRITYGSETLPPDIDLNWAQVKKLPSCIGDFTWTGWDYIGEAGVGVVDYNTSAGFFTPYPCYLAYVGDIDITGHRRPMSYYREIVWGLRKEPYIAVQYPQHYEDKAICTPWIVPDSVSSWTWSGYEGKPCKVEVYSDADEVELFLNGVSIGKQQTGEANRFKAIFDTIYQPGTLEAVGYRNGEAAEKYVLQTAEAEVLLDVQADRTELKADGEDLSYLMISLVDPNGILNTSTDRKVRVKVEGSGDLQGFGSADPLSKENFYDSERTTFNGKVLAVIRSTGEPGEITISVSADGCKETEVKLKSIPSGKSPVQEAASCESA